MKVAGLKIGASSAGFFAGVGPYWVDANNDDFLTNAEAATPSTDAIGVKVDSLSFGLALLKAVDVNGVPLTGTAAVNYTALS